MKNFFRGKVATVIILISTFALAGVAIFTAIRLYQLRQTSVSPNAPESKPFAQELTWEQQLAMDCNRACNLTTNPVVSCPSGFTCVTTSTLMGANGVCRNESCPTNNTCSASFTIAATASPTAGPKASCNILVAGFGQLNSSGLGNPPDEYKAQLTRVAQARNISLSITAKTNPTDITGNELLNYNGVMLLNLPQGPAKPELASLVDNYTSKGGGTFLVLDGCTGESGNSCTFANSVALKSYSWSGDEPYVSSQSYTIEPLNTSSTTNPLSYNATGTIIYANGSTINNGADCVSNFKPNNKCLVTYSKYGQGTYSTINEINVLRLASSGSGADNILKNWLSIVCPTVPTPTPTATPAITATPTATPNPSGTPNSCGGTCGSNSNCSNDLVCSGGYCRNPNCTSDTDCTCASPTATATSVSSSSVASATPSSTPAALPQSGTNWPTIFAISIGTLTILGALLLAI